MFFFCISAVSVVIFPLSFLILFFWVLSLFFLVSLTRGLSILSFKKTSSWFYWSLLLFFYLYFIYFLSDLYFLPSADIGFCRSYFSNSFRWEVRLFGIFLISWGTSLLELQLLHPSMCCHYCLSWGIFWWPCPAMHVLTLGSAQTTSQALRAVSMHLDGVLSQG